MGLDALRRAELGTLALGLVAGVLVALLHSRAYGLGIVVGAMWGAANLWALAGLLRAEFQRRAGSGSRRAYFLWGTVKFPLLYGGGYLLLSRSGLPVSALLVGLGALFIAWIAEAAWHSVGVNRPGGVSRGPGTAAHAGAPGAAAHAGADRKATR